MIECNSYDYIEFDKGILDKCIDAVYVILLEGSDRQTNVYKQINDFKLCKKNYIQINKSYKKCYIEELYKQNSSYHLLYNNIEIFKHSKKNNFNNILILEDDFIFTENIKNINIIKDIEGFIETTNFNLLYLCNLFIFLPNLYNIKFPYVLLNGLAHSIIYSKRSRDIIVEKYKLDKDIKYLLFENHDIWYNSFLDKKYFYYRPLCFQILNNTENKKGWSNSFIDFILHIFKLDTEPISGMNNYYIIIYIIYVVIFIVIFYVLYKNLYK